MWISVKATLHNLSFSIKMFVNATKMFEIKLKQRFFWVKKELKGENTHLKRMTNEIGH